ncbi:MAG: hypothetical protein II955_03780, partial [Clostridia bacterium]|nr:hypothetical protein [Clostridia bacterium]
MKKILSIALALILAAALAACGGKSGTGGGTTDEQNTNADTADTTRGQNEIADTSETYQSISEVASALVGGLSDDQKNVALPTEYSSDVYSIAAAGNYYFSGALTGAVTVAKNAGNVHVYLDSVTLSVE